MLENIASHMLPDMKNLERKQVAKRCNATVVYLVRRPSKDCGNKVIY